MPDFWHEDDVGRLTPDELRAYCAADPAYAGERDEFGYTPLLAACELGNVGVARVLVEMGADPNAVADDGETALRLAVPGKTRPFDAALFDVLLDAGADPNGGSQPPLHLAALRGGAEAVALLVARGADPNGRDVDDCRPLYSAKATVRELLIDLGADPTLPVENH